MFNGASSFNQPLNNWNVSQVTDMRYMFHSASSFNQPLETWDVSRVTLMSSLFNNASSFNQPLNNWDISQVTDLYSMFYDASSFNQPLNNWDVALVKDMRFMFYQASSFNQSLNSWEVVKVTRMSYMFRNASSFNQPLNNWNVSRVAEMNDMFYGVTLSTENYDDTLIGWSQLILKSGVDFHGGNSRYSSAGEGARQVLISNFSWVITDGGITTVPSAPLFLSSTTGEGQIMLNWSAPMEDGGNAIFEYQVYWSTTSGTNYTWIGSTTADVYQYNDFDVVESTQYYYTVTAVNDVGESDYATEITNILIADTTDSTNTTDTTEPTTTTDDETTTPTDDNPTEPTSIAGFSFQFLLLCIGFTIGILYKTKPRYNLG